MTSKPGLFPMLLGRDWKQLSAEVKRMHGPCPKSLLARGIADVEGSPQWIVRLLRRKLRLPSPGQQQPVEVSIERCDAHETWARRFGSDLMRSRLCRAPDAPLLMEKLGIVTLFFALTREHEAIDWQLRAVRLFRLPMPLRWFGTVHARCASMNGRYTFQIDTRLPLLGQLVAYRGWLEIVDAS
jgi:hypothetical protein